MKKSGTTVEALAEKCKNILASNWQGNLNTIKYDAGGSKGIHTSKVKYFLKKGKPYIWLPEKDLHNLNIMLDERGSLAVSSPLPGPLAKLFRSLNKPPIRIALCGAVVPLSDKKSKLAAESLRESVSSEQKAIRDSSYSVSGILSSSNSSSTIRSKNLQDLLDANKQFVVSKFDLSSISYIESNGHSHEVDLQHVEASKAYPLSLFSASLIDGINQSEARRRALMLFCATFFKVTAKLLVPENVVNVEGDEFPSKTACILVSCHQCHYTEKDAYIMSVDRKGFDVLGKVLGPTMSDGSRQYQWKELRFTFREEARDAESFCRQLVEMEEEVLQNVRSSSGL